MMHINWVEIGAIITIFSPGLLLGAYLQHVFRKPQQRADVAHKYTTVGLELLEAVKEQLERSRKESKRLEQTNDRLEQTNIKLSGELSSTLGELRRTRDALERCAAELAQARSEITQMRGELAESRQVTRLLVEGVERVIPLLQRVASGDEVSGLAEIVGQARRSLNGHTDNA